MRPSPRRSHGLVGRWIVLSLAMALACGPHGGTGHDADSDPRLADRSPGSQLPILAIDTTNWGALTRKDEELAAAFTLTTAAGDVLHRGGLSLRGRGNTSWESPKRPYRLELDGPAPLLGMPASRHWVLLANHFDKTLLRNEVAFELSRLLGMPYTPRSRFVELRLHGWYQGVYQLVEKVRVDRHRVDIDELDAGDTGPAAISGGYLLEVDERYQGPSAIRSSRTGMVFRVASPRGLFEPPRAAQRDYLERYLRGVDEAILGPDFADPELGYAAWIDVDSAIGYHLVNELLKNVDGNLRLSTFLSKPRGGKLTFGPVWDFDLAIGNATQDGAGDVEGWHTRTAPWFARLFEDPAFAARVRARWDEGRQRGLREALLGFLDGRARQLAEAQRGNFARWPILATRLWPSGVARGSYEAEVGAMRAWLVGRWDWLDAELASPACGVSLAGSDRFGRPDR